MSRPDSTQLDLSTYKDKPATPLHQHFTDWIMEKTGYDPAAEKTKLNAFQAGVRLGAQLRMTHQASPENQARIAEKVKASEERAVARIADKPPTPAKDVQEEKPARRPTKAAKADTAAAPAAPEPVEEPAAKPAAKPAARRRAMKATGAPAPF